ncbi:DUF2163 domain-containing protein [Novosphingobium sp. KACC 22771]|uniref:DUF2163 domain-containing protein n=1 Tax=Novosphingobium sp. KACC 22771 TaxID=3025670 RepID=UPI0023661903|nr:DUF2163 domain-containing protein [Novosphingobium sp. KACC 22771]WDF72400.1 DUF2163 domain-containing protein [Novosphingobium sp. KACC 22771]
MSRVWFAQELETVATYWRIMRGDGVALGFTTHDRDLWFDGLNHMAAPGMMPAAIRRTAGLDDDSAEITGAISHEAIRAFDLQSGRFEGARVVVGVVDWETMEHQPLYRGAIGAVSQEMQGFVAELESSKAELARDPIPRTSPTCRAQFCDRDCALSAARFTHEATLLAHDLDSNLIHLTDSSGSGLDLGLLLGGTLRWIDGPYAGLSMTITGRSGSFLMLDHPLDVGLTGGLRVVLREGCDHTLATCGARFGNAVNFRGEPFLPGNDLVVRYGVAG